MAEDPDDAALLVETVEVLVGCHPFIRGPPFGCSALRTRCGACRSGEIDQRADAQAAAAHLAEHRERHVGCRASSRSAADGCGAPTATMRDWLSPNSQASGRIAPSISISAPSRSPARTMQHSASATARPPSETSCAERTRPSRMAARQTRCTLHLDGEIDPRRRAAHQVVHDGQVLAAAELLARAAEQDDDVAFALEPLRGVVLDVA